MIHSELFVALVAGDSTCRCARYGTVKPAEVDVDLNHVCSGDGVMSGAAQAEMTDPVIHTQQTSPGTGNTVLTHRLLCSSSCPCFLVF